MPASEIALGNAATVRLRPGTVPESRVARDGSLPGTAGTRLEQVLVIDGRRDPFPAEVTLADVAVAFVGHNQ
ncbi:hypothetical protein [Natrinema sp. H-ect4]|uniref:hypothetical protein n=1 Tax=Natrinema sp. H-ect4 TaxID=3242699 RepID=UPI0035A85657